MAVAQLSPTQVIVLKTLARSSQGMTRGQIEEKTGVALTASIIGPIYVDDLHKHPESLYALKLVQPLMDENSSHIGDVQWHLTKVGRRMAESVKTREHIAAVVPGNVLDPVVIKFRPTRTYGIEKYTDDDMREIISQLGEPYADVSLDALRQQIANRRKMGKYTVKEQVPEWYTVYRQGQHWTALVAEILEHNNCAVNTSHKESLGVYHRRFKKGSQSIINQETDKDLIVLCESCNKKLRGSLPVVPPQQP
jgi:hypothetical protein